MFKRLMWILMIVSLIGLSACTQEEEPVDEIEPEDNEEVLVSLTIPTDYPTEVLPIYPDGFVEIALSMNKSYTIVAYYDVEPSVLIEYYKEIVKDASNLMVTETAGTYTAFGELDDHTFTLDIGASTSYKDYPTSLSISLTFNQK